MKRIIRIAASLILLSVMLVTPIAASTTYSTYTYSSDGYVLKSPDAYVPEMIVNELYMGTNVSIGNIADICTDERGYVYLADDYLGKVVVLDPFYHFKGEITGFVNEQGIKDGFSGPRGVFVNDKYIYVCDTFNSRIVIFDKYGDYSEPVKIVGQPTSNLFETDDRYQPVAVAVDSYGRLFVVSQLTYQGIIMMGENGDFYGFIGAQKTSTSTGINAILEKLGLTDENADANISTEYNNITIDSENFVYATISTINEELRIAQITSKDSTYSPVKKFNASGTDVLARNGFFAPSGEVKTQAPSTTSTSAITGASTIIDAAVGPYGTWSILDSKRSKIYTYDSNGNLLFAFGDNSYRRGNILTSSALCYHDTKLLVTDTSQASFTVFRRTEYGDILLGAIDHQNDSSYTGSAEDWQEILKRNNNFDVAYIGIGKALVRDGEYEKAMDYFKASHEKENRYADAFKQVRKQWASKYFILIPIIAVAVLVGLFYFFRYVGKVNKRASLKQGTKSIKEEVFFAFHVMVHPFDGFWDLKHEKRGSPRGAFIVFLLTVAAFAYKALGTGYVFDQKKASDYSGIYSTIISVAIPLALWIVANWCLTTLFDGEGTFSDIFTASCYALIPLPLFMIPSVILSNFLVPSEQGIITTIVYIGYLWTGALLYIGIMRVHEYTFGKNLIIVLLTIVGMALIMFLSLLFFELMAKLINLFTQLWVEISFRTY
ncbi:MAG: YIP1 family protein [Clostridia bacterium]|nr:YIP1 family protein [Clostridia bacterium]